MGNAQQVYAYISQTCDQLAASASPSIDTLGHNILISLATIMLVWFGIQEALSAAQGGPGFSMAKFLNFFVLITFAYSFVTFYDSSIPGLGFSLKSFVIGGTNSLADSIGTDANTQMLNTIQAAVKAGADGSTGLHPIEDLMGSLTYILSQFLLMVIAAVSILILAYGAIAGTVVGLLGPIFIPFMIFDKTEFLFNGWLKAFISFEFFKVVGAAVMFVISKVVLADLSNPQMFSTIKGSVENLPILFIIFLVSVYIVVKIPAITVSIFSGSAGGHDGGMGAIASTLTKAALA